jgi:hypothetical protein
VGADAHDVVFRRVIVCLSPQHLATDPLLFDLVRLAGNFLVGDVSEEGLKSLRTRENGALQNPLNEFSFAFFRQILRGSNAASRHLVLPQRGEPGFTSVGMPNRGFPE